MQCEVIAPDSEPAVTSRHKYPWAMNYTLSLPLANISRHMANVCNQSAYRLIGAQPSQNRSSNCAELNTGPNVITVSQIVWPRSLRFFFPPPHHVGLLLVFILQGVRNEHYK